MNETIPTTLYYFWSIKKKRFYFYFFFVFWHTPILPSFRKPCCKYYFFALILFKFIMPNHKSDINNSFRIIKVDISKIYANTVQVSPKNLTISESIKLSFTNNKFYQKHVSAYCFLTKFWCIVFLLTTFWCILFY